MDVDGVLKVVTNPIVQAIITGVAGIAVAQWRRMSFKRGLPSSKRGDNHHSSKSKGRGFPVPCVFPPIFPTIFDFLLYINLPPPS